MSALTFLVVFGAGLVAGGLIAVSRSHLPTLAHYPHSESVQLHGLFFKQMHPYMMPTGVATTALAIVTLIVGREDHAASIATALGIVGMAGVIVTTETQMGPINRAILSGSLDDSADDYERARKHWWRAQVVRTFCAAVAFACFIVAAIIR